MIHPQLTKTFIEEVRLGDSDDAEGRAPVQARARDPAEGRRRVHDAPGRHRARDLAPHGEDPPRADLREARRERPRPGGRDRDPHRHRALSRRGACHRRAAQPSPRWPIWGTTCHCPCCSATRPTRSTRLQYDLLVAAPDLEVEVTSDAFRAVETAARTRPDVIVCSLGLEGLSAAGACIRRLTRLVPRVGASWRSAPSPRPAQVASALAAGAAGFVGSTTSRAPRSLAAIRSAADRRRGALRGASRPASAIELDRGGRARGRELEARARPRSAPRSIAGHRRPRRTSSRTSPTSSARR